MITYKHLLLLPLFMLAVSCVQTGQAPDQILLFETDETFVPFKTFIEHVKRATYEEYKDTKVESKEAFEQMRQHILEMYDRVTEVSSFVQGKEYADCIKIKEQASFRALGLGDIPKPPLNSKFPDKSRDCVPGVFK